MSRPALEWTVLHAPMVASAYALAWAMIVPEWRCARDCPVAWFAMRWFRRPPYLHLFAFLAMLLGLSSTWCALAGVLADLGPVRLPGLMSSSLTYFSDIMWLGIPVALVVIVAAWTGSFFAHNRGGPLCDLAATPISAQDAASPFFVRIALALVGLTMAAIWWFPENRIGSDWSPAEDMLRGAVVGLLILSLAFSVAIRGWHPLGATAVVALAYAVYGFALGGVLLPGIYLALPLKPLIPAENALSVPAIAAIAWGHYRIYRRTRLHCGPKDAK